MEQLIEKIIKAPWATKIGIVAGIVVLICVANYFLVVSPAQDEIGVVDGRLRKLEGDFIDKQQIANNLNQYRREKEILEQRLAEALTELPNEKDIDDLLRQLNDVGVKSGLEITSVEPMNETPDKFFARIPINMKVTGNYHEIAVFFDSVGKLKRIVNIANLAFKNPRKRNEKVILDAEYQATTFRFLQKKELEPATKPKPGARPAPKPAGGAK